MEYATRDQAQHAVNTLSNQNLMGRLVYVREVSSICPNHNIAFLKLTTYRTVNPSHVLVHSNNQDHPMEAQEVQAQATRVGMGVVSVEALEPLAVKSMCLMSVFVCHILNRSSNHISTASLQRGVARS